MIRIKKNNQGLTLIELLVASVLAVALFFMVMSILVNGLKSRSKAAAVTNLQKTAASILSDMTVNARWAEKLSITPPGNPNKVTVTNQDGTELVYSFSPGDGTLTKSINGGEAEPLHESNIQISTFELSAYPQTDDANRVVVKLGLIWLPDKKITYDTAFSISVRIGEIQL